MIQRRMSQLLNRHRLLFLALQDCLAERLSIKLRKHQLKYLLQHHSLRSQRLEDWLPRVRADQVNLLLLPLHFDHRSPGRTLLSQQMSTGAIAAATNEPVTSMTSSATTEAKAGIQNVTSVLTGIAGSIAALTVTSRYAGSAQSIAIYREWCGCNSRVLLPRGSN